MRNAHNKRHGRSNDPIYTAWKQMRARCSRPSNDRYKYYGARGIRVCEQWHTFENFLADMGERPSPAHSVERRDNDKDYCPDNCFWATIEEQRNNMRSNVLITYKEETLTATQWAKRLGVNPVALLERTRKGWSDEKIIERPYGRWI
jgi:hypothetical protein